MRQKLFTQGITVFCQPEMYAQLKQESDEREIGMSELIRGMVRFYFDSLEELKQKQLEEEKRRELEMEKALEQEEDSNE